MNCKHCGKEIDEQDSSCKYCGQPTRENAANQYPFENTRNSPNPLEAEMLEFVDSNQTYYDNKWRAMGPNFKSWNLAAFFFSLGWLGYRKMYSNVLLFSLLLLMADVLGYILFGFQFDATLNTLITLAIWLVVGRIGNGLYRRHAKKKVEAIRRINSDTGQKHALLKQLGGTSWFGVVYAFLIVLFIYVLPVTFLFASNEGTKESEHPPAPVAEPTDPEDIQWKTYANTKYGYHLDYPDAWKIAPPSKSEDGVSFLAGEKNEINVFADVFNGNVSRQTTGITEEIQTDDGHLAIVNRTEKGKKITYEMSILEGSIEYRLEAVVTLDFAEENEDVLNEMIQRFEVTAEETNDPSLNKQPTERK